MCIHANHILSMRNKVIARHALMTFDLLTVKAQMQCKLQEHRISVEKTIGGVIRKT